MEQFAQTGAIPQYNEVLTTAMQLLHKTLSAIERGGNGRGDALPVHGRIGFLGAGALADMMPLVSQMNTLAASLSSLGSAHAAKLAAAVEQADAAEA